MFGRSGRTRRTSSSAFVEPGAVPSSKAYWAAVLAEDVGAIQEIHAAGTPIHGRDGPEQLTPLHLAANVPAIWEICPRSSRRKGMSENGTRTAGLRS